MGFKKQEIEPGDEISWITQSYGKVVAEEGDRYIVKLPNGQPTSIHKRDVHTVRYAEGS